MPTSITQLLNSYKNSKAVINCYVSDKPAIIVPDIHGRVEFVKEVLRRYSTSNYDIVFVGDILHSEGPSNPWGEITDHFVKTSGQFNELMEREADRSIKALELILDSGAYFVRGNHDDVSETLVGPYGKYSNLMESSLFKAYVQKHRKDFYNAYLKFEKKIPYLFVGPDYLVSHAIPNRRITPKDLKLNDQWTHWCMCWSDNTYPGNSCVDNFAHNLKNCHLSAAYWFCGHRPVDKGTLLRVQCNGQLVQNNNPTKWVIIEKPYMKPYEVIELDASL